MDQLIKFINNLNTAQRAVIIGGFSLLLFLLVGLLVYSNIKAQDEKLNYTIATNLTKNQVMSVSSELEASGIPFTVVGNGDDMTMKTSKEFINIAKIRLVTSEANVVKHNGWELFENSSLGTTNFENKIKYLRALEGELSRSLEGLSGVTRANVKIAIPKDTIFTERKLKPTASAVLTLKPGIYLTQKQIDGIKNFIASAISDLEKENIKLIDQDGNLLEHNEDEIDDNKLKIQHRYKEKVEKDFEKKIISLLEPVLGYGKVVAKVSVDLDFTKQNVQEEIYQPEGTIRSQQTTESTSNSQSVQDNGQGVPGVQSNIEDGGNGSGGGVARSSNEETKNIVNYEISKKIVSQVDNGFANIRKISAAVTFDSTALDNVENRDELITSIEQIVQNSIGYTQQRGDNISVRNFKFVTNANNRTDENGNVISSDSNEEMGTDTFTKVRIILKDFGEYIQYIIAALLLFIFYKKFIANHEILVLSDSAKGSNMNTDLPNENYEDEFDYSSAQGRLKAKVKSQILNNIEGLDEESAAKYEVLIEELDKTVTNNPKEIADMIDLLLQEGTASKLKAKTGKKR